MDEGLKLQLKQIILNTSPGNSDSQNQNIFEENNFTNYSSDSNQNFTEPL